MSTLERHQRRRDQGIPTLTLLSGPPASALALWSGWLNGHGRPLVPRTNGDERAGVWDWLTAVDHARSLRTLAEEHLGAAAGEAPGALSARLATKTEHERDVLLQGLEDVLPPGDTRTVSLRLLRMTRPPHASGAAPRALLVGWDLEPLRVLAAVHALVPERQAPALLLSGAQEEAWLSDSVHMAARVCVTLPSLPVALQAPSPAVDAYLRGAESQTRALVREGRVSVEAPSREDVERRIAELDIPTPPASRRALEQLTADGVPDEVLVRYGEAAREVATTEHSPEAVDRARSSAERFLYALLEAMPDTRGLFELNARAGFLLRGRSVEVDFLSRRLRLAIEVDGYHHFRDESGYRRDRRKDLALQRHGYWVLRFLARDVVADLELIRDTLREVIPLRRPTPDEPASH